MLTAGISPICHAVVTVGGKPVEPTDRSRVIPAGIVFVVRSDIKDAETLPHGRFEVVMGRLAIMLGQSNLALFRNRPDVTARKRRVDVATSSQSSAANSLIIQSDEKIFR